MSRFYFHVSAAGENFRDDVGSEAGDLAAVHSKALLLAEGVMAFPCFRDARLDFRRWTVKVTDERQRPVITVLFPGHATLQSGAKAIAANDARTLLLRLGRMLSSQNDERRLRSL